MTKLSTPAKLALVAAGCLVMLVAGWFLVVAPKRSDVSDLKRQIAATNDDIAVARGVRPAAPTPSIRIAELFKLSRAMPDTVDVPGLMLQLSRIAGDTGVAFESITPHDPVPYSGYQQIDVDLVFEGRFYDLSDFLYRLRNLVDVHNGVLNATGRLFTVSSIQFSQGQEQFPQVKASLTVSAYVFGDGTPSPVPGDTAPTGTGTPTSTTPAIESSQPIPAAPAGATAAGA
jgi:Tfp pilus assembly protein PilO